MDIKLIFYMTREELKQKRLNEENEKIESLKGKQIAEDQKNWFRGTHQWREFRDTFENVGVKKFKNGKEKPIKAVDPFTLNPLKKGWQLHHCDLDSRNYTNLIKEHFLALNPQSHDFLHWAYTQMCKDKDFIKRFEDALNMMYEINGGKDIKDFK